MQTPFAWMAKFLVDAVFEIDVLVRKKQIANRASRAPDGSPLNVSQSRIIVNERFWQETPYGARVILRIRTKCGSFASNYSGATPIYVQ